MLNVTIVKMSLQMQSMPISRTVDCAIKDKPSELFGCFDPDKNKQHNQYDLLDDIGIFPQVIII